MSPVEFGMKARTMSDKPFRKSWRLGPSRSEAQLKDIFRQLQIDPLHEVTNSSLMSEFVTEMGKIKGRAETGLTWRSQRMVGKAIRRAKGMGIIPWLSKRPLSAFTKQ